MSNLFTDALRQILADHCSTDVVRQIETQPDPHTLWDQLDESGFANVLLAESTGGAGLSLRELFPLLELCGQYALPLPFGETIMGRALLSAANITCPKGLISLSQARMVNGVMQCNAVRGGSVSSHVLVCFDGEIRLLSSLQAQRTPDIWAMDATLMWSNEQWKHAPIISSAGSLLEIQAAVCSAYISGALTHVLDTTLQYAGERRQFGQPIAKFQAIQHQLSVMAEHCFAARMAAQMCFQGQQLPLEPLRVAVAKARTSEAALEVASLSHSVHGAIGFTAEYDLQIYTRRLHAWRQTAGSESYWHDVAGAYVTNSNYASLDILRSATDFITTEKI